MIASQEPESSGPVRSLRGLEAAYLRPYRRQMVWALAAMVVQSLLLLPLPWIQGSVIDRLARGGDVRTLVATAVAILVICQLGRMGLAWLSSSAMNRISLKFVRALTDGLHRKLQRLPLAWFDRQETGQVMSRLTSDVGTLLIFLSASSLQLAADLVLAAGIVVVLVLLAWPLAIASFIALPLFVWNQRHFASRLMTLSQDVQEQTARLFAVLSERISAVRTVRAFGMEPREIDLFRGRLDSHAASSRQRLRAMSLQSLAALLTSGLATAVVVVMAAILIQRQWLSLGQAAAFVAYLGLLYLPLVRLTQFYGGISATLAAVQRIAEVLDEPEPAPPRRLNSRRRVRGELRLQNVSFRYGPDSPAVLHRIHMAIQPGSTIGLWGPSGAGKSTLLALLPRLYDLPPGCGRILLDGRDVAALPPAALRRSVMLVPQQARLFAGTMRFNLTYAAPEADAALIRRALDAADLTQLVESLPQGLETPVGERGASLSGGQRQRLALARALIAQPRVLLLDDCTSALDAQTEARVRQRALDFCPAQTRIIASHKPEAFAGVDWLVCLEGGQIVRQGTPQKLLAEGALAQNALALVS